MGMPALHMGDGQPAQILRKVAITARPQHQVPVVRHDAIGKQPRGPPLRGLGQDAQKGGIVAVLLEQGRTGDRPIEDVIDLAAVGDTQALGHGEKLTDPFSVPRRQRVPLDRINFIDALRWLRDSRPDAPFSDLIENPSRPNRIEPRVIKRRMKEYTLMKKPRQVLRNLLLRKKDAA